ncbi:type II toxin-antitoxin system VapC family toxin [Nocardiopsis sp. JB363]|uniref:type II toxin-antitoxin system VapC family toxin n=1 Tax=Nocardiopsis sp. JB363 TaxID=1434837 RepID=UPI00117F8826|nr:PIN domain-containing protein [Nocardiopsis sp. JB363]
MAGRRVSAKGTLVLDSAGLSEVAAGAKEARAHLEAARRRGARVVTSAVTLTEVLRGGARDASVHRVLARIEVVPISPEMGRESGELLGRTGLSGHRCAIDSVVAVTALRQPRPVVLLTSDPNDLETLVEEPERPRGERVVIVRV